MVERDALVDARSPDVYTLGECRTETWPSSFDGPETIRSSVVLFYGSFLRLAAEDEQFDWQAEVWETLTHELQHHLEALVAQDALGNVDAAVEENFRRLDGDSFAPYFYRLGEREAGGWYRLENSWFFEIPEDSGAFEWQGQRYRVAVPASDADVLYLTVEKGVAGAPDDLCLVRVRTRSLRARLGELLGRGGARVAQHTVRAERQ